MIRGGTTLGVSEFLNFRTLEFQYFGT
ncbi:Protein CBG27345 [Caenorhabditis briggsae]|uniref:Protein CBG27345 n=1 Tax=Caenorhabditis briggsae TaxID=6238 RepID=B6IGE6_CAEBR|nr:Protein CBG27345 [Caenorhabditis briggsae]CAR98976.1 Protein CBG27345 [Caenorhabditis briggsae]